MTRRSFMRLVTGLLFLGLTTTAHAIVVCHDYTLYRITGKDPRPLGSPEAQGSSVKDLRDYLSSHGYTRFPFSNAIANPEQAQRILKPGYILIIRDDHSGYVNEQGQIDHFIQKQDAIGKKYDVDHLPPPSKVAGGFFEADTLRLFLTRPFRQDNMIVEVWRR